jgi:MFS family permease
VFAALGSFTFLNSLYLQDTRGFSPLHTGLCILPVAIATIVFSPLSGRLVAAYGARPSLLISGSLLTASALLLLQLDAATPLGQLLLTYTLFGVGYGMANPPITFAAVSGMPRAQAGLAAGIASTSRQTGVSIGVALVGALTGGRLAAGSAHIIWWVHLGFGLTVVALGALSTGRWAKASAERVAHLLEEAAA